MNLTESEYEFERDLDRNLRQTCYIAEDSFADALFPVMFSEELDPCPSSVDFTTLYEEEYGTISVVSDSHEPLS